MEEQQKDFGNLKSEEFLKLKRKHGKLAMVKVEPGEDEKEPVYFWFKKPDMATLGAAAKFAESNPIQSAMIFAQNCLVHGDAKLFDDVDIFTSVAPHVKSLVQRRASKIKNF